MSSQQFLGMSVIGVFKMFSVRAGRSETKKRMLGHIPAAGVAAGDTFKHFVIDATSNTADRRATISGAVIWNECYLVCHAMIAMKVIAKSKVA